MVKPKSTEDMNGTGYEWEYAKKIDNRTTGQKIANFIFNPETHAILGRTVRSWGALLLFYAIFYSILALLFAICMQVLLSTLDDGYPKWQLEKSIIGTSPGLGFRPMPDNPEASSVIWFNERNKDSWVKSMDKFINEHYNNSQHDTIAINCSASKTPDYEKNEYCKVDVEDGSFEECSASSGYGFRENKPCVFIKLNRIYGWVPEYYNTSDSLPDIPGHTKERIIEAMKINPNQVWVSCDGQSPHDKENQGEIVYYPSPGFPNYFYPYLHTKAYMSPLVAVQFKSPKPNVLINIECRAWAKNIHYKATAQQREGSVHFEIQVDDK